MKWFLIFMSDNFCTPKQLIFLIFLRKKVFFAKKNRLTVGVINKKRAALADNPF